jgi:AraC-like DNA-binding protein
MPATSNSSPPAPVDRLLFESATGAIGAFRCAPGHPLFADSGPIEGQLVVFPRTAVEIAHEGSRPFVADACVATIYNRGQRYRRRALDPQGDRCDWFAVTPDCALELARRFDPAAGERPGEPYRHEFAPVSSTLYLRQRRLFDRVRRGGADPLAVDEELVAIVEETLLGAFAMGGARRRANGVVRARSGRAARTDAHELAEGAAALLGAELDLPLSLATLSRRLGVTAPHLCRTFRRVRGTTLHQHRTELRLRAALEAVRESGRDLTEIALACGFSSHSHFTNAFRRRFGAAPSQTRGARAA